MKIKAFNYAQRRVQMVNEYVSGAHNMTDFKWEAMADPEIDWKAIPHTCHFAQHLCSAAHHGAIEQRHLNYCYEELICIIICRKNIANK